MEPVDDSPGPGVAGPRLDRSMADGNPVTTALSAVRALATDYYRALTHMCSAGQQLAAILERELKAMEKLSKTAEITVLKDKMSQISSFHSVIISVMGPLWHQTRCDTGAEEPGAQFPAKMQQQYNERIKEMSACLLEFHLSVIDIGACLMSGKQPSVSLSNNPLGRKDSPSIVITDTECAAAAGRRSTRSSQLSSTTAERVTKTAKTQLPSDEEMDSLINFLSSTRIQAVSPVKPALKSSPIPNPACRRLALAAQRSSPLPGASDCRAATRLRYDGQVDVKSGFVRHHSDWQLYTRAQGDVVGGKFGSSDYGINTGTLGDHNDMGRTVPGAVMADSVTPPLPVPFSGWSAAPYKDSIWSRESAASSGDESLVATDQLFHTRGFDWMIAARRPQSRRPSESSESSQTFDAALTPAMQQQQHAKALAATPAMSFTSLSHNEVWSATAPADSLAHCWSNSASSDQLLTASQSYDKDSAIARPTAAINTHSSIWEPIDLASAEVVISADSVPRTGMNSSQNILPVNQYINS